jgi:hypothetical protein
MGPWSDVWVETRDGLQVVVKHIWPGLHHGCKGTIGTLKIRYQNLDPDARNSAPYLIDRLPEVSCAAI